MFGLSRKKAETPAPKKGERSLTLYAADDLLTRAENIVRFMGYSGEIGGIVLDMYRFLQLYEKLDAEAAGAPPIPRARRRRRENDSRVPAPDTE